MSQNKQFRQYLKRRKAAKLMTPAARLAMDAVGQIWDAVGEKSRSCRDRFSFLLVENHLTKERQKPL